MAEPIRLAVASFGERKRQAVVEVLRDYLALAEAGKFDAICIVALEADEDSIHFGASGVVNRSMQVGMLERMKARIIAADMEE